MIYSADIVNGRGNFGLYRVHSSGGASEAVTQTPRHEFAPDVSPDGSRIAFASNRLGNMDLFTMPVEGGEAEHVGIQGLKFRQPSGAVRVTVVDELGEPTAVRLYVESSDGKGYAPGVSRSSTFRWSPAASGTPSLSLSARRNSTFRREV